MPITFLPTYKFKPHTNEYDKSDKKRVPSYCDRVLWHEAHKKDFMKGKTREYIKPICYEDKQTLYGDHKPV